MKKILPKDRVRSEKGAGKQAKRWRNTGHERVPAQQTSAGKLKARTGVRDDENLAPKR